ncbi:hypothetical protein CVT26_010650 [Gymnopilus dilepis]|uniref:Methyltransferase domain-containing protein n=1 Tax=Gymnopilus dilepis TaxID=231916 RepID=A0A409VIB5_9AGAR|nr:hypothetical protein CVT26_010650 [Gymnopilus dilepis]
MAASDVKEGKPLTSMADVITPNAQGLRPSDIVKPEDPSTWELAWIKGVTPWDFKEPQLSLKEAIESSGLVFPSTGNALVPGCGGGYDIPYLANTLGWDTLGLEIADTAIKIAEEIIEKEKEKNPKFLGRISKQDFFTLNPPDSQHFDLIYDHTFFVAIPPSLRPEWAKQMAKLVKPGGYLITVLFPLVPDFVKAGPPYHAKPEHYTELLSGDFEKVVEKVPEKSSPSHVGQEVLMIWRRKVAL